ncbi:MAG: UDP-N-acetylglucosamine--undecaprenyl-phosphate N-acetylglucosaminephosphotransferase [Methylovulum miyakonense]|uniref:UDP-N-acetylglucosamine--undecaprenyl-phosphate N-acetylglucosaminephosphotransferase n=1 Tax=Methylovulum miyakonense TaxID=645578 RepID=UPI003BB783AF
MPLFLFLTSLIAALFLIILLIPYAKKISLVDRPSQRKQHKDLTPLIGGLAIYLAMLVTLLVNDIQLFHQKEFIVAATLLVCVGVIDDYKELSVKTRIIAQIIAGLIMAEFAEIKITELGDIFGAGSIKLGEFSTVFTILAVVGGINAFNMIDGIDGLAGTLTLVAITSIAVVSKLSQNWPIYYFCLILMASIIAFLLFNLRIAGRKSASIFLGDTGSTLLGFSVCWLAICASQGENRIMPPVTVLWLTAVPFFDSISVMYRRIKNGRSPCSPDREHLHHYLARLGYGVNQKLIILVSIAAIFSIVSLFTSLVLVVPEQILFFTFLGLFAGYYWYINNAWKAVKVIEIPMQYPEIQIRKTEDLSN